MGHRYSSSSGEPRSKRRLFRNAARTFLCVAAAFVTGLLATGSMGGGQVLADLLLLWGIAGVLMT